MIDTTAERAYLTELIANAPDKAHRAMRCGDPALAEFYTCQAIAARARLADLDGQERAS